MHFAVDHVVPLDLPYELKTNTAAFIGKPDALSLWAESNTKPAREKQGAQVSPSISQLNIYKETASFYSFNIPATVSAASVNRQPLFKKDRRHAFLF